MTDITEFLFPAPAPRSMGAIVKWWESRRLAYNLIVGTSGLVSMGVIRLVTAIPPAAEGFWVPLPAVVVFGMLANLCYGMGAGVEIALDKAWGRRLLPTGPALFRMGLTFSVGLTLLPTLIASLDWVFRLVRWIL